MKSGSDAENEHNNYTLSGTDWLPLQNRNWNRKLAINTTSIGDSGVTQTDEELKTVAEKYEGGGGGVKQDNNEPLWKFISASGSNVSFKSNDTISQGHAGLNNRVSEDGSLEEINNQQTTRSTLDDFWGEDFAEMDQEIEELFLKDELEDSEPRRKKKKFYKKLLLPLLLAYKLKFVTIVPLLIAALVLLAGSTGMAGFFFALFAAAITHQKQDR
ncbi:hypothetical protein C0J52_16943 [Blattella germanica]|nr:hypothetical protein C0J52_16943 [Blattella germanica]